MCDGITVHSKCTALAIMVMGVYGKHKPLKLRESHKEFKEHMPDSRVLLHENIRNQNNLFHKLRVGVCVIMCSS